MTYYFIISECGKWFGFFFHIICTIRQHKSSLKLFAPEMSCKLKRTLKKYITRNISKSIHTFIRNTSNIIGGCIVTCECFACIVSSNINKLQICRQNVVIYQLRSRWTISNYQLVYSPDWLSKADQNNFLSCPRPINRHLDGSRSRENTCNSVYARRGK